MRGIRRAALICCTLVINVVVVRAADEDQQKLEGRWIVDSFEYNGNPMERMKEAVREFKDGKYTLTPKSGDAIEGTVKIGPAAKPKTIDLVINDRTLKGIYDVEGDTLKLCYILSDGPRPAEFASKPDSGVILVLHKRAK